MTSQGMGYESEASVRITPAEVRGVLFAAAGLGRRGYDEREVDDFLDMVEAELERLAFEKVQLQVEVAELREELTRASEQPSGASPQEEAAAQAVGILRAARETAEQHLAQARARAEELVAEATAAAGAVAPEPPVPGSALEVPEQQLEEQRAHVRRIAEECRRQLAGTLRTLDELDGEQRETAAAAPALPVLPRQVDLRDQVPNGYHAANPE